MENPDTDYAGSLPVSADYRLGSLFYREVCPLCGSRIGDVTDKDYKECGSVDYFRKDKNMKVYI